MKIALGTVQFGFSYGISNTSGRTEEDQVLKILDYAWKNGINTLDTARDYGDSERIIGKFKNEFAWNIVTKTPSFSEGEISEEQLKLMRISFNNSLNNLDKRSIDTLLVHSADDLLKPGGAQLFSEMTKIKNSGFVKNIGASVYSDNQILNEYPPIIDISLFGERNSFYRGTVWDPHSRLPESFSPIISIGNSQSNLWDAIGMEYTHYVQDYSYGNMHGYDTSPRSGNHLGSLNPSTADSWVEGVGTFMPAIIADRETFLEKGRFGNVYLEQNIKSDGTEWLAEEYSIATLLWDLYDKYGLFDENVSLSIVEIWKLIKGFDDFDKYNDEDYMKKFIWYGVGDGEFCKKHKNRAFSMFFHLAIRYPILYPLKALVSLKFRAIPFCMLQGFTRLYACSKKIMIKS